MPTNVVGATPPEGSGAQICASCGQHRGWLSKSTAQWIGHVATRFGAPTTPIVVRGSTLEQEGAPGTET